MKPQRVNTRPGTELHIVHPFASWMTWQVAAAAFRELGRCIGLTIIVRAANTDGWKGTWIDGRPR